MAESQAVDLLLVVEAAGFVCASVFVCGACGCVVCACVCVCVCVCVWVGVVCGFGVRTVRRFWLV